MKSTDSSLSGYFLLVLGLSIPVWLIAGAGQFQQLPGLPLSALMAFCPAAAASILLYMAGRETAVGGLLKRSFDWGRIERRGWYLATLLLMPTVMAGSFGLMRLMGTPVPNPRVPGPDALAALFVFFISALGEELGWTGYILESFQQRWSPVKAGVLLGSAWAIWHIVPLLQANRSPSWIAWQSLETVSLRVVLVWLYNRTGKSVFATSLCHATLNTSWYLFPIDGSYYDPRTTGLILTLTAASLPRSYLGARAPKA